MTEDTISTLVASTNRGRYALDDPEHGSDLTSGKRVAIRLGSRWIAGEIAHGSSYRRPGCYHIADKERKAATTGEAPTSQEWHACVQGALAQGKNLSEALSGASGQIVDLFCGYYFIAESDGAVCGLCTGMHVRRL